MGGVPRFGTDRENGEPVIPRVGWNRTRTGRLGDKGISPSMDV